MTSKKLMTGVFCLAIVAGVARADEPAVAVSETKSQVEKVLAAGFAPIILGGGNMVDSPTSPRDTHERSAARVVPCPPGIMAVCVQRAYDRLAYLCLSGLRPKEVKGQITKTTAGCERDKPLSELKATSGPKKCRTYTEQSLNIVCDGPEDLAGLTGQKPVVPAQPVPVSSVRMPQVVPSTAVSPEPVPTAASPTPVAPTPASVPQALDMSLNNPDAGPASPPDAGMPGPAPDASAGTP